RRACWVVEACTARWVSATAVAASLHLPKSSSGIGSASFHKCDARHHSDFSLSKCTPAKAWPTEQRNCLDKPTRSADRSPTLHLLSPSSPGWPPLPASPCSQAHAWDTAL